MAENPLPKPINIDFKGNVRGKCKMLDCDCLEYVKRGDSNACDMCGCYPGKHELILGKFESPLFPFPL